MAGRDRGEMHRTTTGRQRNVEKGNQQETTTERERPVRSAREESGGLSGMGISRPIQPIGYTAPFTPFSLMRHLTEDLDRLFSGFGLETPSLAPSRFGGGLLSDLTPGRALPSAGAWSPQIDVFERDDKLIVRADLPGLSKEDIDVSVDDGTLTIEGERKHEYEDTREGVYRSERSYGRFFRSIPLPEDISPDQVEARFNDGVLEVTMPAPKRETKRARKINIR